MPSKPSEKAKKSTAAAMEPSAPEQRRPTKRERLLKQAEPRAAIAKLKRDIKTERMKRSRSQKKPGRR